MWWRSRAALRRASLLRLACRPRRITPIYNPTFTPDIARRAEAAPAHPWFGDDGAPVILGAGRLAPQKDFPTLIEAFRRVSAARPCRLVILGEGRLRPQLEGQVRALGLEDRVSLPGWAENPYAFMSRAALFVLSSRHEGFPGVLIEALACGCPAASTDCPAGPSEILEDAGLLAPVGDAGGAGTRSCCGLWTGLSIRRRSAPALRVSP